MNWKHTRDRRFRVFLIAAFVALCAVSLRIEAAQLPGEQVVWTIGRFDNSSAEFHPGAAPTPAPVYVMGKSVPAEDWYEFQPGSLNREDGARPHPLEIRFRLHSAPKGLYTLKVGMLVQTRRLSVLQVELNGHQGWLYQRPHWLNVPGKKRWQDLAVAQIPTRDLRAGENVMVLTAIDEASEESGQPDSGITYDALELDRNVEEKFDSSKISVSVHPTIFYKRKNGALVELVDVFVTGNAPSRAGRVRLEVNHQRFAATLAPDRDFGEQRVEFWVPEFTPTQCEVAARLGAHRSRFSMALAPAKKWTVYVLPHEHLDVGYTDYQAKVAAIHSRVVDEALGMIHANPDFRYSTDGSWVIDQFFAGRSKKDRSRLIRAVQQGRFFVPAQYANLLTGFPTAETLIRSLYPSFEFDQRYDVPFDYANDTDVPSYTWSYPSILAASGIKYFLAGCDQTRGPMLRLSHLQERSPFWWEGPDGKKVLMWYSDSYGQVTALFGLPPRVENGTGSLPRFLQVYAPAYYKPSSILLFGAQYENSDLYPQQATFVGAWNKIYAYPELRYSGFVDAIKEIAKADGNSIPVYRGDGGPYWEDGIGADAYYAAMNRESEERALSAEKISTLSFLVNPRTRPDRAVIRRMWRNLVLYDEHTWGAAASIPSPKSEESTRQLVVKDAFAVDARNEVQYLVERGLADLADKIDDPSDTWVVFNPLSWPRSGLATGDLPKGSRLVDLTTKQTVPYQVISVSGDSERIRFWAQDVPSLGYKCYAVRPAAAPPARLESATGDVMENAYYRVVLDPQSGAVKSIFDKQLDKEVVNTASPYRFDQYAYVTGGDQPDPNSLLHSSLGLPVPKLAVYVSGAGRLVSVVRAPFGWVARLESSTFNTPRIDSEIILFNHRKEIEFINHVHKAQVFTKEGVYFAFPLAMQHPEFRYEIQNGYVDPARDQLPGAGKEWFSVQHWIAATGEGATVALVPIDAPLVTLGDIVRGVWPIEFGRRKGTIFSYIMNNYWFTNYRAAQGGNFTFRYVLTSARAFQPAALSRLGWSAMTPFEVDDIISNDKAVTSPEPLSAAENSFVTVQSPNVVLTTWKRAENQQGTVMRFLEVAGQQDDVTVQIPRMQIQRVWLCDAMERDRKPLPASAHQFSFVARPFQIVTVRLEGAM